MRVLEVIQANKAIHDQGEWKAGKIPAADFRFFASQSPLRIGDASWQWRIVEFSALHSRFKVLIKFSEQKQIFNASLAIVEDGICRVICVRDWHPGEEPGWHCHAVLRCEQGRASWSHYKMRRWPRKTWDRTTQFKVDKAAAFAVAVSFFRLDQRGDLL